jgi:hypothetical protein
LLRNRHHILSPVNQLKPDISPNGNNLDCVEQTLLNQSVSGQTSAFYSAEFKSPSIVKPAQKNWHKISAANINSELIP